MTVRSAKRTPVVTRSSATTFRRRPIGVVLRSFVSGVLIFRENRRRPLGGDCHHEGRSTSYGARVSKRYTAHVKSKWHKYIYRLIKILCALLYDAHFMAFGRIVNKSVDGKWWKTLNCLQKPYLSFLRLSQLNSHYFPRRSQSAHLYNGDVVYFL